MSSALRYYHRIDSALGYTQDNCRVIVWAWNAAFGTWGADAFEEISLSWTERSTAINPSFFYMAA